MRRATERETYFRHVEREGELTVELALLFARLGDSPADRRAAAFLRGVAAPANLLDKLVDLRGDHRRGEVAIDPGIATHVALAVRMVRHSWIASARYSSRMRFTIWGLGWLLAPARDAASRVLAPR